MKLIMAAPKARPLHIKENWKDMAELALMYSCPLVVPPNKGVSALWFHFKTLMAYECVTNLVISPGTFANEGLPTRLTTLRNMEEAATKEGEELLDSIDGCSDSLLGGKR